MPAPGARASACGCRRASRWWSTGRPMVDEPAPATVAATTSAPRRSSPTGCCGRPTMTVGAHAVIYLHRRPRPPASNDQPMPYVARTSPGWCSETARQALALADAAGLPRDVPLTLIEAPLRHELVQPHGSHPGVGPDLRIFPVDRLRKYHHHGAGARDLAAVVSPGSAPHEPGPIASGRRGRWPPTDGTLHAPSSTKLVEYSATISVAHRFRPAGRPAALCAAARFFVDLLGDVQTRIVSATAWASSPITPARAPGSLQQAARPGGRRGLAGAGRQAPTYEAVPFRRAAAEMFGADLAWFWGSSCARAARELPARGGAGHAGRGRLAPRRDRGAPRRRHGSRAGRGQGDGPGGGSGRCAWTTTSGAQLVRSICPPGLQVGGGRSPPRLVETALGSLPGSDDPRYGQPRAGALAASSTRAFGRAAQPLGADSLNFEAACR